MDLEFLSCLLRDACFENFGWSFRVYPLNFGAAVCTGTVTGSI